MQAPALDQEQGRSSSFMKLMNSLSQLTTRTLNSWFTDEDITEFTFLDDERYYHSATKNTPLTSHHQTEIFHLPSHVEEKDLEDLMNALRASLLANPSSPTSPDPSPNTMPNQIIDRHHRTLLHYAVKNRNLKDCQFLLQNGANLQVVDKGKRTVLHHAMMYYDQDILQFLLDQEGVKDIINARDYLRKTPLNTGFANALQLSSGNSSLSSMERTTGIPAGNNPTTTQYVSIVLKMKDKGADLLLRDISNRSALDRIAKNGALEELLMTAILQQGLSPWCDYLANMKSPLRLLNKLFKYDERSDKLLMEIDPQIKTQLPPSQRPVGNSRRSSAGAASSSPPQSCLYWITLKALLAQDVKLLYHLLCLHTNLESAAKIHHAEAFELYQLAYAVQQMIIEIFHCESMDFPLNIQRILQPGNTSIGKLTRQGLREPLLLTQARAFQKEENVLVYALQKQSKILFSMPEIASFIDDLLYSSIRKECLLQFAMERDKETHSGSPSKPPSPAPSSSTVGTFSSRGVPSSSSRYYASIAPLTRHQNDDLFELRLTSSNLRFCPIAALFLRFLSKIILLALIAKIVNNYSHDFVTNYGSGNVRTYFSLSEVWLLIFTLCEILYEVGLFVDEVYDHPKSAQFAENVGRYVVKHRNVVELASLIGIVVWSFLRIKSDNINTARVILALVAIPQAICLLRYLSLYKPLGELVIVLRLVMMEDITIFAALYIVILIGFGITLFGLFHDPALFPTTGLMFLQLFEYTLNTFDFSIFQTNSVVVNTIGVIILICFLVITTIVLVNLLIARLSNTHQRVADCAVQEWSITKAQLVGKFLTFQEKNPLRIIPPPFNILTIVSTPFHYYFLTGRDDHNNRVFQGGVSLAGTIANMEYTWCLGSFIRIYGILGYYLHHLWMKWHSFNRRNRDHYLFLFIYFPFSFISILCRMVAIFFAPIALWHEAVDTIEKNGDFDFLKLSELNGTGGAGDGNDASASGSSSPFTQPPPPPPPPLSPFSPQSPSRPGSLNNARRASLFGSNLILNQTMMTSDKLYSPKDTERILSWIKIDSDENLPPIFNRPLSTTMSPTAGLSMLGGNSGIVGGNVAVIGGNPVMLAQNKRLSIINTPSQRFASERAREIARGDDEDRRDTAGDDSKEGSTADHVGFDTNLPLLPPSTSSSSSQHARHRRFGRNANIQL